jgi:hypothetical protein
MPASDSHNPPDARVREKQAWTIWKQVGKWDDVIEGPDTPHAGVRVISLDAAVAAIIERYCDTSRGLLCSDFRQAADLLREEFGSREALEAGER